MKRLLSLITALAAFVGFAEDPLPADATGASTAESPLCVGFSFNNGAVRPGTDVTGTVTKDTTDAVKGKAFATEATEWFYAELSKSGEVENFFPFTVTETATPDPNTNTEGENAGGGAGGVEAGGGEGGVEAGGSAGSEDGNSSNAGTDDPVSTEPDGTSPETGSEGGTTTPTATAKPKITWSSQIVYATKANYPSGATFLDGYLDDGSGVKITVSNFAHKYTDGKYDVIIYFATDTANVAFTAPTVNGKQYTFDAENPERAKEGNANFGHSTTLSGQTQYGVNALRVCGLTRKV